MVVEVEVVGEDPDLEHRRVVRAREPGLQTHREERDREALVDPGQQGPLRGAGQGAQLVDQLAQPAVHPVAQPAQATYGRLVALPRHPAALARPLDLGDVPEAQRGGEPGLGLGQRPPQLRRAVLGLEVLDAPGGEALAQALDLGRGTHGASSGGSSRTAGMPRRNGNCSVIQAWVEAFWPHR